VRLTTRTLHLCTSFLSGVDDALARKPTQIEHVEGVEQPRWRIAGVDSSSSGQ
jgi:hypothetical protein